MKTLLCEQAGRGSLRYLLFEDAEGGTCRYSVLIEQQECDRSELLRDIADSLPEALARVAEYRRTGRAPQGIPWDVRQAEPAVFRIMAA